MTDLPRSPKSGNQWTQDDLRAYNITVSSQSPDTFYGTPLPTLASLTTLDPHVVSGTLKTQGLSSSTCRFLCNIDMARRAMPSHVSDIQDLVMDILFAVRYERYPYYVRSRHKMPLLICGNSKRTAQATVAIFLESLITLLVVQECKLTPKARDPEPQVIAEAIAVFQNNNRIRGEKGQPELESMTVPAFTMTGSRPIFYLVPVTQELSESVATGAYPPTVTVVKKCVVEIEGGPENEGMENLDFRQLALRHFAAFRTLAETHWSALMTVQEMERQETAGVGV